VAAEPSAHVTAVDDTDVLRTSHAPSHVTVQVLMLSHSTVLPGPTRDVHVDTEPQATALSAPVLTSQSPMLWQS
jgi:hypothetical protein